MSKYEFYLEPGDLVTAVENHDTDGNSFDIAYIQNPSLKDGSRVILDIHTKTGKNVLIGGNPLYISNLKGIGRISMVDLKNGKRHDVFLEPGTGAIVPSENVLYWYDNLCDFGDLIVQDTCPNFDPAHEPSLQAVTEVLTGLYTR